MKNLVNAACVALALIVLVTGCGKNPFGPGAMSLDVFSKIAKSIDKPAVINKEENSGESSKNMVSAGQSAGVAAAKRLAKGAAIDARPYWLDTNWITVNGSSVTYYEQVSKKPCEDDPFDKKTTGTGRVVFRYAGSTAGLTLASLQLSQITDIDSFHYVGREEKLWHVDGLNHEIDSVEYKVAFMATNIRETIKPGTTWAWAKNISATAVLGAGDTAGFRLDSLDDANHTQYGEGHFYDAHSGDNRKNNEAKSFDFTLKVKYINTLNPAQPYLRYQDNQGTLNFFLPWGSSGDQLYFTINFYPYYYRDGTIRKNGPAGPVLVAFTKNEKTGIGTTTFYDENGKVIGND
jgi:hypothetical protein